jgi:hypothetical protein
MLAAPLLCFQWQNCSKPDARDWPRVFPLSWQRHWLVEGENRTVGWHLSGTGKVLFMQPRRHKLLWLGPCASAMRTHYRKTQNTTTNATFHGVTFSKCHSGPSVANVSLPLSNPDNPVNQSTSNQPSARTSSTGIPTNQE